MAKKYIVLKCRRCGQRYDSTNYASKICNTCRGILKDKKPPTAQATRIKVTLQHILASTIQLPYNQGYLQALVDFGHMEKTTLDEIYSIAKKGD